MEDLEHTRPEPEEWKPVEEVSWATRFDDGKYPE